MLSPIYAHTLAQLSKAPFKERGYQFVIKITVTHC